ncbi:MAG: hypothetical protein ABJA34_09235 [Pseudonocardiales bacterium]
MNTQPDSWPGSARSRTLAGGLAGVAIAGFAALTALNLRYAGWSAVAKDSSSVLLVGCFVGLGTLLALRRPANPIGWLLTAGGLEYLLGQAAGDFARHALTAGHPTATARLAATFAYGGWPLGVLCSVGLPLVLFPGGRLASPRWRGVFVAMVAACPLAMVGAALTTVPFVGPANPAVQMVSPWGVVGTPADAVSALGKLSLETMILVAAIGIVVRFRSASGAERQQLRWILTGAVLATAGIVSHPIGTQVLGLRNGAVDVVSAVGTGCLPVSIAIAILRYRLYDLDRIVSRTVSYATVTGLLIAVYVGLVTAVSRLTPTSSSLGVAGSTLAVAALFQPLRRRVQNVVNRRFNRSRYDAARTVEAFTVRLREQVDLESISADMLAVVRQTVQPATASLWLRQPA